MDAAGKKQQPKKSPPGGRSKTNNARVAKVKKLFDVWLQDSSGYDEQAWSQIKKALTRIIQSLTTYSMSKLILLDAGPLGMISHPRADKKSSDFGMGNSRATTRPPDCGA